MLYNWITGQQQQQQGARLDREELREEGGDRVKAKRLFAGACKELGPLGVSHMAILPSSIVVLAGWSGRYS